MLNEKLTFLQPLAQRIPEPIDSYVLLEELVSSSLREEKYLPKTPLGCSMQAAHCYVCMLCHAFFGQPEIVGISIECLNSNIGIEILDKLGKLMPTLMLSNVRMQEQCDIAYNTGTYLNKDVVSFLIIVSSI